MSERKDVPASAMRLAVAPLELGDNGEGAKSSPFRMVARTGEPIDHWFFGRVVHDLDGMQRHKSSLPIDYIHDDGEVIGYANKFDTSTGDLVASGALVPFNQSDRASEIKHKSDAGVPYEASINFAGPMTIEEVAEGVGVEVNGRQFTGPINIIREWSLRGIAVCPYGYDMNTETSLSTGQTHEVEFMKSKKQLTAEVEEGAAAEAPVETTSDTDNVATEAPAVDVQPQTTEEPAALSTPAEPPAEGARFLEEFGTQGGVWFAQGKSYEQAAALFTESLKAENAELRAKLDALSTGEGAPVEFSAAPEPKQTGGRGVRFADGRN